MGLIRIEHHPSRRQLILFGALWLLAFGALGAAALRGGRPWCAAASWAAALLAPSLGLAFPEFLRFLYVGLAYLTFPIGFIVSHVVLAATYYVVLTPLGLLLRGLRYDPMNRRFDPRAESYWIGREPTDDVQRHFRQF